MLLHIGYHKTGTTFLQEHVFTRDKGFCSPWNVYTGEAIEYFVLSHPSRFHSELVRGSFASAVEAAGGRDLVPVISHEDLNGHPLWSRYYGFQVAERLHATFPEARVLIAIREQKSMLRSLFGQYIVQDGMWPITDFIGTGNERPGFRPICRLDHLEYDLLVDHYRRLFGPDRVLVLPFELLKRDSLRFEQQIHDFAGTKQRAETYLPPENVGVGAMTLSVLRRLNQFTKKPPLPGNDYFAWPRSYRAKLRICNMLERITPARWHAAKDQAIKGFIAQRVGNYYHDSNRRLAEMTGLDLGSFGYDLGQTDTSVCQRESQETGHAEVSTCAQVIPTMA
jgi:hypothetical protein